MLRRVLMIVGLIAGLGLCASLFAQGLTTTATKDDWEDVNFEFNSSILSDAYPSLLRLGELLGQHPDYKVKVEGNTDYIGSDGYNDKLAIARAETVKSFLVKYGAKAEQITTSGQGKRNPEVDNRTIEGRFINRRVTLTVTDGQGRIVSAGSVGDAVNALAAAAAKDLGCCDEVLKKLGQQDAMAAALRDLAAQNGQLKQDLGALGQDTAALKQGQAGVQQQVAQLPKPLGRDEMTQMMEAAAKKALEEARPKRFEVLELNLGPDTTGNLTATGKARFFTPFGEGHALQAQGEYLRYSDRQEGQFDFGLLDRRGGFQAGLFSSFKRVELKAFQAGGTLGQAAVTLDYVFSRGRVGAFGAKSFLDEPVIGRQGLGRNLFLETYLNVVDQVGGSAQIGLYKNSYVEGNLGMLFRKGGSDRPGGTVRLVLPLSSHVAFTAEAGLNETLLTQKDTGRVVFGLQFGNWVRPKEFGELKSPVPVDVPRIRYEMLTRTVRVGNDPPVADAGPDQINVAAGLITLDGSGSYDPDGDPITYQWSQISGPTVSITGANTAQASFTSTEAQTYVFRLVVKDDKGASGQARVTISTAAAPHVQIIRFAAEPSQIKAGEKTTLVWEVRDADEVTISGIGNVDPQAGTSTVTLNQTTTYTLTAKNSVSQETATLTVTVDHPVVRIVSFVATPATIASGQSTTLSWQTENATEASIGGIGSVNVNGVTTVSPTVTTTYTLTAKNQTGQATATVTVTVTVASPAVRIVNFLATPAKIAPGQSTTLSWQTENATEASIGGIGSVNVNGSTTVSPTVTTTYTLTAKNQSSQATATVTVEVGDVTPSNRPPVADAGPNQTTMGHYIQLDGSKSYDPDGDTITYSWRVAGAKPADIYGATTATPTVMFLQGYGDYVFELTVTDAKGARSTATTTVNYLDP